MSRGRLGKNSKKISLMGEAATGRPRANVTLYNVILEHRGKPAPAPFCIPYGIPEPQKIA